MTREEIEFLIERVPGATCGTSACTTFPGCACGSLVAAVRELLSIEPPPECVYCPKCGPKGPCNAGCQNAAQADGDAVAALAHDIEHAQACIVAEHEARVAAEAEVAALLALAEAAATNAPDWYTSEVVKAFALNNGGYEADAPFIVAASPHRVKALLAALAAAEAEREAVKLTVDRLLQAIGYVHVEINDDRVAYPEAQDDPFDYAARIVKERDAARAEAARLRVVAEKTIQAALMEIEDDGPKAMNYAAQELRAGLAALAPKGAPA